MAEEVWRQEVAGACVWGCMRRGVRVIASTCAAFCWVFLLFFLLLGSFIFLKRLNELKRRKLRKWPPSSRLRPTPTAPPRQLLWGSGSSTVRQFRIWFKFIYLIFFWIPKLLFFHFWPKRTPQTLPGARCRGPSDPSGSCCDSTFDFFKIFFFFWSFLSPTIAASSLGMTWLHKGPFCSLVAAEKLKFMFSKQRVFAFVLQFLHSNLRGKTRLRLWDAALHFWVEFGIHFEEFWCWKCSEFEFATPRARSDHPVRLGRHAADQGLLPGVHELLHARRGSRRNQNNKSN